MIWGQFVGDASALGTHWIYNLSEMKAAFPVGVFGFESPREGHYHAGKSPGDQTHYGDAALIVLESVATHGRFEVADFGARFFDKMNPDRYRGYIDHATRGSIENRLTFEDSKAPEKFDFQQGADDDQMATISSLAPIVAAHWRDDDLLGITARPESDRTTIVLSPSLEHTPGFSPSCLPVAIFTAPFTGWKKPLPATLFMAPN